MKTLQSIFTNLLLLAFVAACTKKEINHSEFEPTKLDFENQKQKIKLLDNQFETRELLIDERPYYVL